MQRFDELRVVASALMEELEGTDDPALVRADWGARNAELGAAIRGGIPAGFLRLPPVRDQMFVGPGVARHELPYVLDRPHDHHAAMEDPVGDPPNLIDLPGGVVTSSNLVHQLFHALRYRDATGRGFDDHDVVVEWGGGYGCLAKVIRRLHGGAPTQVLIDTSVFAVLQWLYLRAVVGDDVLLHRPPTVDIRHGSVNVVPLAALPHLDVRADLFISNWALNESTPAAQRAVQDRDWFGAPHLLVSMHRGDPLEGTVLAAGATAVPLGAFMPGQHYFVR